MLLVNSSTVRDRNNVSKVESDRIGKLEQMFETLLKKVHNIDTSESKQICGHCGKANHGESTCFKLIQKATLQSFVNKTIQRPPL